MLRFRREYLNPRKIRDFLGGSFAELSILWSLASSLIALHGIIKGVMRKVNGDISFESVSGNAVFELSEEVLSGRTALSDAMTQTQNSSFISSIEESEIEALDKLLRQLSRDKSQHPRALLIARLNFATAIIHPDAGSTVKKECGLTLLRLIPDQVADMVERARICEALLNHVDRNKESESWAFLMRKLGIAYAQMPIGRRADNLEKAIDCFLSALQIQTRDALPREWAKNQINLGNAYKNRIKESRRENLEKSIECYQFALEVLTKDAFPYEWAVIKINLGVAYKNRIEGEKADNLEKAIKCCHCALEILTRDASPQNWAAAQNNLGVVYFDRIKGEKADNLEKAIEYYESALGAWARDTSPYEWARTRNNLGLVYSYRLSGEKSENLERAIEHYRCALEVLTRNAFPHDWANTQRNLALAYSERILGEREDNLERAVECFRFALKVYTKCTFPQKWAMVQNNLGSAYIDRMKGDKNDNLEHAIECYQSSLKVYTKQAFPQEWAMTRLNLGTAYLDRIVGSKNDNLGAAIKCFRSALEVYTRKSFPQEWAMTRLNLGTAYGERILEEKAENLDTAVECYQNAIDEFRSLGLWDDVRKACMNLGNLYYKERKWQEVCKAYIGSVSAMEHIRSETLTDSERSRLMRENSIIFERLVICFVELGQYRKAAEHAGYGRARNLSELLVRRDLPPRGVPGEIWQEYERLLFRLRVLVDEMRGSDKMSSDEESYCRPVEQIRSDLLSAHEEVDKIAAHIHELAPDYLPKVEPMSVSDMQHLARELCGCIVQLQVTERGTYAFLITGLREGLSEEDIVAIPGFTNERLSQLLVRKEAKTGKPVDGWLWRYYDYQHLHPYSSAKRGAWHRCLAETVRILYQELLAPVHQRLRELEIERLVLIPTRGLSILPLHAASYYQEAQGVNMSQRCYFLDDFEITYAPSYDVLERCLVRDRDRETKEYLSAIANPCGDLVFSDWEVAVIADMFPESHRSVLWHEDADLNSVLSEMPNGNFIHFSCHGMFNHEAPLESCLQLAGGTELTLRSIFQHFDASDAYLVSLSACETGMAESFEYMGLPAGFLLARANCVVGSLWAVNDLSTALLMTRLYENILHRDMGRAAALREAQIWLRNLSKDEAMKLLQEGERGLQAAGRNTLVVALSRQRERLQDEFEDPPFEHPYWWAAFQCIGVL